MITIWRAPSLPRCLLRGARLWPRVSTFRTRVRPAGGAVISKNTGRPSWSLLTPGMANRHLIVVPYMPASGVAPVPLGAGTAYTRGMP